MQDALQLWNRWDAAVSKIVFNGLYDLGIKEIKDNPSVITADLPFVASPTPVVSCIIGYLVIVITSVAYQKMFPKPPVARDPLWLRIAVQAHNVFLIALSLYMCLGAIYNAWINEYSFWGNGYNPEEVGMGITVYIFYMSKLYEFFDTYIMLLKGKDEKKKKKYLWWGKYLTQFQMFQFVTMMVLSVYASFYSPYPKSISMGLFFYMVTLLALFYNFYSRKHLAAKRARQAKEAKRE